MLDTHLQSASDALASPGTHSSLPDLTDISRQQLPTSWIGDPALLEAVAIITPPIASLRRGRLHARRPCFIPFSSSCHLELLFWVLAQCLKMHTPVYQGHRGRDHVCNGQLVIYVLTQPPPFLPSPDPLELAHSVGSSFFLARLRAAQSPGSQPFTSSWHVLTL